MKTFKLAAEPRTELGKKATQAIRDQKKIPVVLNGGEIVDLPYKKALRPGEKVVPLNGSKDLNSGKGVITTDLMVENESVRKLVYTPEIFAIELDINGEKRMAVLKDLQFHPVKDTILHMDLLEVSADKPVVISVPVQLEGHAEGVKAGGKLSLSMKKLKVRAPYTSIPERLVINVDNLALGKAMQVGDLHFEGLELVNAKNAVVCAVQLTRAARGAQAAAAAE
ncbi:MAG: 50S ribosomal protein L25 [Muribaculaceae bacterium]|nr:50S ribosomal protein L25 [Muribaculaceae bacterium]